MLSYGEKAFVQALISRRVVEEKDAIALYKDCVALKPGDASLPPIQEEQRIEDDGEESNRNQQCKQKNHRDAAPPSNPNKRRRAAQAGEEEQQEELGDLGDAGTNNPVNGSTLFRKIAKINSSLEMLDLEISKTCLCTDGKVYYGIVNKSVSSTQPQVSPLAPADVALLHAVLADIQEKEDNEGSDEDQDDEADEESDDRRDTEGEGDNEDEQQAKHEVSRGKQTAPNRQTRIRYEKVEKLGIQAEGNLKLRPSESLGVVTKLHELGWVIAQASHGRIKYVAVGPRAALELPGIREWNTNMLLARANSNPNVGPSTQIE